MFISFINFHIVSIFKKKKKTFRKCTAYTSANSVHRYYCLYISSLCAQDDYHIELKSDTRPYALTTPRRVAAPLMSKVKAEVQQIEALEVISKVDQPRN